MNKDQILAKLNALFAQNDALQKQDTLSDAEQKSFADNTSQIEDLQKQLDTIERYEGARRQLTVVDNTKAAATAGASTDNPSDGAPAMITDSKAVEEWEIDTKTMKALGIDETPLLKTANRHYKNAFRAFLVGRADREDVKVLDDTLREVKTMVEGIGEDGGYLAPVDLLMSMIAQLQPATSFLSQCQVIDTTAQAIAIPRDSSPVTDRIQWVGEIGQASDDQPTIEQKSIKIHEGRVPMEFSSSLMQDAPLMERYAMEWLANAMTYGLEVAGLTGNGAARPMGALTQSGTTNGFGEVNVGNPATATGLIDLVASLPAQYRNNAVFLCNDTTTWGAIMKLRDADNALIGWLESVDARGLANARSARLLGYPAGFTAAMPGLGSGNKIGLFGDLRAGYAFVRRMAITVERWAPTKAETTRGVVGMTAALRYGGDVIAPWAAKVAVQS